MLGGVVFREFFDYEYRGNNGEGGLRRIIPSMDYTMRLSPEFVNTDTDILFPVFQLSGPGKEGPCRKKVLVRNRFKFLFLFQETNTATSRPSKP